MKQENKNPLFTKKNLKTFIVMFLLPVIFGKIFEPILDYLFLSFLNIGGILIEAISDYTYFEISNGFSEQGAMFAIYILYLAVIWFLTNIANKFKNYHQKDMEEIEDMENILRITPEQKSDSSDNSLSDSLPKSPEALLDQFSKLRKRIKRTYFLSKVLCFFTFLLFLFMYSKTVYVNNSIISFTNNIEIVSPYITDQEYKELKSEFHSMKSKEDGDQLEEKLQNIAKEYSLTLK